MNAGLWEHDLDQQFDELVDAVQSIEEHTRSVWKTTTPSRDGKNAGSIEITDHMMCRGFQAIQKPETRSRTCLNLTWIQNISPKYYIDAGHFKEPIYRLMNEQLLLETLDADMPIGYIPFNKSNLVPRV
jgi:hypothetical protein